MPRGTVIDPNCPRPPSFGLWWFLVLVVAGAAILWFVFPKDWSWKPDVGASAFRAARALISEKSPAGAKFSQPSGEECGWEKLKNGDYRCWGYVDSRDAAQGPRREDWETQMARNGDFWRPVYCRVGKEVFFDGRAQR